MKTVIATLVGTLALVIAPAAIADPAEGWRNIGTADCGAAGVIRFHYPPVNAWVPLHARDSARVLVPLVITRDGTLIFEKSGVERNAVDEVSCTFGTNAGIFEVVGILTPAAGS